MNIIAPETLNSNDKPRLAQRFGSFDIFRAFAAWGVILIHTGLLCDNKVSRSVGVLQSFFSCAVPFFLVTAFYFAARRENRGDWTPWKEFIVARARRLLIPFLLWDVIYSSLRAGLYITAHHSEKLRELLVDPVAILISGTGVMLYFLPLLFVGLMVLHFVAPSLRKLSGARLACLLIILLVVKSVVDITGNRFQLIDNHAFGPVTSYLAPTLGGFDLNSFALFRILFVALSHAVRCLPLIVFGFLVLDMTKNQASSSTAKLASNRIMAVAGALITLGFLWVCSTSNETHTTFLSDIAGLGLFLLAAASTDVLPSNRLTSQLGAYTFGIYLSHQVVLTVLRVGVSSHLHPPLGLAMISALALLTFILSYGVTAVAARCGALSRRLFAIEA
jgi:peptidoglycan/LPS O-acetylase OafA/YrhL